jgi:hypothetical protein
MPGAKWGAANKIKTINFNIPNCRFSYVFSMIETNPVEVYIYFNPVNYKTLNLYICAEV